MGLSLRQIAHIVGRHHSTISRLVNKSQAANDDMDLPRPRRPPLTRSRENQAL